MRTLSARLVVAITAAAALAMFGVGGVLGYWLAAPSSAPALAPTMADSSIEQPAHRYTLQQIGALSARLFRLESQAAQLGRHIGLLPKAAAPASAAELGAPKPPLDRPAADARGGPLLQPRSQPDLSDLSDLGALGALGEQLERVERHIDLVSDAAALRHAAWMRLPSLQPIVDGKVVSTFGNRSDPITSRQAFHAGLDFAAPYGTPILAAAGGRVDVAEHRADFGWMIEIEHGNGLRTRYAHASKLLVRRDSVVVPGQTIALVGSTGRSTGPHLHFEVLRQGAVVDPHRFLARR